MRNHPRRTKESAGGARRKECSARAGERSKGSGGAKVRSESSGVKGRKKKISKFRRKMIDGSARGMRCRKEGNEFNARRE